MEGAGGVLGSYFIQRGFLIRRVSLISPKLQTPENGACLFYGSNCMVPVQYFYYLLRGNRMGRAVSVLILSDNRLFRESLGRILSKRADLEVASSLGFSEGAYREALRLAPDVVVLDSLEFLYRACEGNLRRNSGNGLSMLLVAMEENEQTFLRAIRAGAMGFVPKEASALDVVAAVRSVARGEAVCPPKFCRILFECVAAQAETSKSEGGSALTRRERQLVPMIGQGLTNKEIAQQLSLSEQTIKNHIHRILHKLGAENRMGIMSAVHTFPN